MTLFRQGGLEKGGTSADQPYPQISLDPELQQNDLQGEEDD
jgi:hypothetical protein